MKPYIKSNILCSSCDSLLGVKTSKKFQASKLIYDLIAIRDKYKEKNQHKLSENSESATFNKKEIIQVLSYILCPTCKKMVGFRRQDNQLNPLKELKTLFFFKNRKIEAQESKEEYLISEESIYKEKKKKLLMEDLGYLCDLNAASMNLRNHLRVSWIDLNQSKITIESIKGLKSNLKKSCKIVKKELGNLSKRENVSQFR